MGMKRPVIHGFQKKSIFWKTFFMISIMSIATILIFGIFINQLMVSSQRSRIHDLSLMQLRQTSKDVEMRLDVLEESMEQTLWSNDFVTLMVNPVGRNSNVNYRVASALAGYASGNSLIHKAWFYVPALDEIYSSSGSYMSIDSSSERRSTMYYLENYEVNRAGSDECSRVVYCFGDRVIQAVDFCVPNFIGVLFFELDTDQLNLIVQENLDDGSAAIQVYDAQGNGILPAGSDKKLDLRVLSSYMTDSEDKKDAEYYLYTSDILGWHFVRNVDAESNSASWNSIMSLMLPFLLIYFIVSQVFSMYITSSVYRPINRLMQIADRSYRSGTVPAVSGDVHNEVDYLELIYTDTLDQNIQHHRLMEAVSNDLMEQLFRSLLTGKTLTMDYINRTMEGTGNRSLIAGRYIAMAGVMVTPEDREPTVVETGLYQRSVIGLISQIKDDSCELYPFYIEKDILVIICCFHGETSALQVKQTVKNFEDTLLAKTKTMPYQVIIGRGKVYNEITSLRYSYQEALADVRYRRYMESEENRNSSAGEFDRKYYEERTHQMAELAEKGSREEAMEMAGALVDEVMNCSKEKRLDYCERILDALLEKIITGGGANTELKSMGLSHSSEELQQALAAGQLRTYMVNFCDKAIRAVQSGSKKNRYKYVNDAKEYIETHYSDGNLSLNHVSDAIGISAPYLSGLFNEVIKENFNSYLNSYRVKQAKQFLEETSQNIAEIGYKCGFNSAQSFSRVFKKYTGYTPGQYREWKKGQQS